MTLRVDASEVLRDLDTFESHANEAIERQFVTTGQRVWSLVNADTSFRGQKLRRSIQWERQGDNRLRVFTAPAIKHASFVNDGTRPHDIVAKPGKTLRFVVDGNTVFRKKVHHPGTRPTLFFERATNKAFDEALPQLEQRFAPIIKRFNR